MIFRTLFGVAAALLCAVPAVAKDIVRVVDSQALVFDAYAIYLAKELGYYDAENLDVTVILGRGGTDSLQPVLTGNQDIIYGTGVLGVISAAAKGAPVTIIASGNRGAGEIYWFVKADSPIKSFKDLDGREFIYSTPGSVTHLIVNTIAKELNIKPKFVSAGAATATRTAMMSGQTDTAWSPFPANVDLLRKGETRRIGTGGDSDVLNRTTTRVSAANSAWLAKNRDAAIRFMRALRKGQEYLFTQSDGIPRYAKHWNIDLEDAKSALEYFSLERTSFSPMGNLDGLLQMSQEYGFLKEPVSPADAKKMIDIVYEGPKK
jgi:NitT/TauT family transport system substrate-binding protein